MSTKPTSSPEALLRVQSKAALAQQRRVEAETALEAARAEQVAIRERTARLRALRLAKEAADEAAALAEKKAPRTAAKRVSKKVSSAR